MKNDAWAVTGLRDHAAATAVALVAMQKADPSMAWRVVNERKNDIEKIDVCMYIYKGKSGDT